MISLGRVVIVAPIAASYPVWSLIQARIFLRGVESINWKVVAGIGSVVAGNFAIHFGRWPTAEDVARQSRKRRRQLPQSA